MLAVKCQGPTCIFWPSWATHWSLLTGFYFAPLTLGFSSVQFSCSVVSDSLQPHESQHARPPCPSPTPGVHPDSCPLSQWCHPAISSSVIPFSCPQSLPASESFPISQLFPWGGQSTGVSALASFLSKKSQGWSPSEWTGWISLQSKGLSKVFSNTTVQKHQFFSFSDFKQHGLFLLWCSFIPQAFPSSSLSSSPFSTSVSSSSTFPNPPERGDSQNSQ